MEEYFKWRLVIDKFGLYIGLSIAILAAITWIILKIIGIIQNKRK